MPQLTEAILAVENRTRFLRGRDLLVTVGYYALQTNIAGPKTFYSTDQPPVIAYRVSSKGILTPFSKAIHPTGLLENIGSETSVSNCSKVVAAQKSTKMMKYKGSKYRDITYTPFDYEQPNPLSEKPRLVKNLSDPSVVLSDNGTSLFQEKGYRLAKCSHAVSEGRWFFETILIQGNCRVGWATLLADIHAPLGYDEYGYAYADKTGNSFHCRIGRPYGPTYSPGDTIGCLIELPFIPPAPTDQTLYEQAKILPQKIGNILKMAYPPIARPAALTADFKVELPPLLHSKITFFKNGHCLGTAFKHLYHASYRPAISLYQGKAILNFGPSFKYPPPISLEEISSSNNEILSFEDLFKDIEIPALTLDAYSTFEPIIRPISDLEIMTNKTSCFDHNSRLTFLEQQERRRWIAVDPNYKHPAELEQEEFAKLEKERVERLEKERLEKMEKVEKEKLEKKSER